MLCTASRALCWVMTGHRVMLCTLAHDLEWRRFVAIVDAAFMALRGEAEHCRRCWEWERNA